MKVMRRDDIKEILKDLKEQLNAGIEIHNLYSKGFYYNGDNILMNDDVIFEGRITKKEMNNSTLDIESLESYKILGGIMITVYEKDEEELTENEIVVSVNIKTEHSFACYDDEYIIDIASIRY